MWKWIKKLFSSKPKKENLNYPKMSKGDLKRLKAQGIIKSIYKPYN